jgi:ribosome-binding protein aMBF1 (putative translation factor)
VNMPPLAMPSGIAPEQTSPAIVQDISANENTAANEKQLQQKFAEALKDEMAYGLVSRDVKRAISVVDIEQRRAKRRKLKGAHPASHQNNQAAQQALHQANSDADDEIESYQRKIVDYEEQMRSIRAKYAGRRHVSLSITLADLGASLVTAREAGGLSQVDLADRLHLPLAHVERWEECCYADLPLAQLCPLVTALGLNPKMTLLLVNEVPDWDNSYFHQLPS